MRTWWSRPTRARPPSPTSPTCWRPSTASGWATPSPRAARTATTTRRSASLRAAFNHVHVFLDPSPDPARSFAERERLFRAGKGWDAYDPALLSPGGAVLARAAKRVTLSPEARAMLGLGDAIVSGERLVQAVLTLDVDLLWN